MRDSMIRGKKALFINGALLFLSFFFSLLLAETLLRIFTPFPIHSSFSNKKAHDELGWVLSPKIKDSDEKGFRNKCYIPNPDIVAIGDSHTYGYNVPREESWPEILSRISGKTVYNFGMGGYGISQYVYLVKV